MEGINRALLSEDKRAIFENYVAKKEEKGNCVFISHKSNDIKAAEAVAKYLTRNGIDVYLDKSDTGLQQAIKEQNAQAIVKFINRALMCSTHILVLVSDQTQESWWVPYEVGYAKKAKKKIASALLAKNISGFPDYLKIEKKIKSASGFKNYVLDIKGRAAYGYLIESVDETVELNNYIRSVV